MKKKKNKKIKYIFIALLLVLSIGYALLTSILHINGISIINNPKWDVHFENINSGGNIYDDVDAQIVDDTTVSVNASFDTPGDYFFLFVDVVNAGDIDAMIDSVDVYLGDEKLTEENIPKYLEYSLAYKNYAPIKENAYLFAGEREKYFIFVEFKRDITAADLPVGEEELDIKFSINYIQGEDVKYAHHKLKWEEFIQNKKELLESKCNDEGLDNEEAVASEIESTPTSENSADFVFRGFPEDDVDFKFYASIAVETDAETGDSNVVVGNPRYGWECHHDNEFNVDKFRVASNAINSTNKNILDGYLDSVYCSQLKKLFDSIDVECVKRLISEGQ